MTFNRRSENSHGQYGARLSAFLHAMFRFFRGSSRGAASVEHVLILSVAVTGAAGFSEFGDKLQSQLESEGKHIEGKGMPRGAELGDLGDITANFDIPEQACPGGVCSSGAPPCSGCTSSPLTEGAPVSGNPFAPAAAIPPAVAAAAALLGLTPAETDIYAACREAIDKVYYEPLLPRHKKNKTWRGSEEEAIDEVCAGEQKRCPPDMSAEDCVTKLKCIYELVAGEPTGGFFNDRERYTDSLDKRCSDKNRLITRWACTSDVEPPLATGAPITLQTFACTGYPPGSKDCERQEKAMQSEQAGEDAMKGVFAANFEPEYTCETWRGNNVFDGVCWNESGDVIIIEAKGRRRTGTTDRGDRRGPSGGYVQQGTLDYVRGVASAMKSSTTRSTDPAVQQAQRARNAAGDLVLQALASHGTNEGKNLRYLEIRQPLEEIPPPTTPGTIEQSEFDIYNANSQCPKCKCSDD